MTDVSQLSHDLFLRILAVSAQASLLAVLIVALQRLLRDRLSPAWRHTLWGLLFAKLLLIWSVPSSWSLFTALHNIWLGVHSVVLAPAAVQASMAGEALTPAVRTGVFVFSGMEWAIGLWICGVAITLALAVMQAIRLGRQARRHVQVNDPEVLDLLDSCCVQMGVRKRMPMLCGPDTAAPALLGFLQPRLLLPVRLLVPEAREHLRCVLLHELAHIRRRDVLTGWLAYLLLCLHWFNPVLWWAKRRCTDDRELACDARVLSLLTPKERRAYGHALLDQLKMTSAPFSSPALLTGSAGVPAGFLKSPFNGPGLVGVLDGSSSIERRIEMIASFGKSPRKGSIPALAAILLLAVTALTGAEESVLANQPAGLTTPVLIVPEAPMLLARETPESQSLPIPTETAEQVAAQPQATLPAEEPAATSTAVPTTASSREADRNVCRPAVAATTAATESKPDITPTPATAANTATKANGADSRQLPAQRPDASTAGVPPALITTAPTPAAPETGAGPAPQTAASQPVGKNPPTLHSAVNKVAEDYAKSIEVKSTRPGEELPFTLTVGGSIQVRGEYWSGLPKHGGLSQTDHAGISTRTRVAVCADFGQVQCVMEASRTQGGTRLFGGRDVD